MRRAFLFLTGHGRHGKDTAAALMEQMGGYRACDSSQFVCERAVFPAMPRRYNTWQECYADRHQHRDLWYDLISDFNKEGHELSMALFQDHDIYTGIRSKRELDAFKALYPNDTVVIWVDAMDRLPPEPSSSLTITKDDADIIIDNNGPEHLLPSKVADCLMILSWNMARRHYEEKHDADIKLPIIPR